MSLGNSRRRKAGYGRTSATRERRRDKVDAELWNDVWERDQRCIAERVLPGHECWGGPSVDHVHWIFGGKRGKKAKSIAEHLVAMCRGYNVAGPSSAVRDEERKHLRALYPSHGTETGCVCDG